MSTSLYVVWWNVENLFDHKDAPRTDKLQRAIGADLTKWTVEVRDQKIDQLASVIAQMNNGAGPELLGACESENQTICAPAHRRRRTRAVVSTQLPGVHADTGDERGIDVAFVYDTTRLDVPAPPAESVFFHAVMRRNATREIVQVNFTTKVGAPRTWAVFGNHWSSRRGGAEASAGYRAIAVGNPRLLPSAGPRRPRPGHPGAGDG